MTTEEGALKLAGKKLFVMLKVVMRLCVKALRSFYLNYLSIIISVILL